MTEWNAKREAAWGKYDIDAAEEAAGQLQTQLFDMVHDLFAYQQICRAGRKVRARELLSLPDDKDEQLLAILADIRTLAGRAV